MMRNMKVLVVSPMPSHPQNAGNTTRLYHLLSNFKRLGCEIHFIYSNEQIVNPNSNLRSDHTAMKKEWDRFYIAPLGFKKRLSNYSRVFDKQVGAIGILLKKYFPIVHTGQRNLRKKLPKHQFAPAMVDDHYNPNLDKLIKKLHKKEKFDIVIAEYIIFSKALLLFDKGTLKLIDTHDVFTNRYRYYKKKLPGHRGFSTTKAEESKALDRADIILAIQDKEEEIFSKMTDRMVMTIGHSIPLSPPRKRRSGRKNLLFVGTSTFQNEDGITYFVKDVFPKVRKKFPKAKLILAGKISDVIDDDGGIVKLGEINDLEKAYEMADIIISPIFIGTGLKIKNIEALSHSKPLIASQFSAVGLESGVGKGFLVAKNTEEFVDNIASLFSDAKLYDELSENAYKFMKRYNKENMRSVENILKLAKKR